MVAPGLPVPYPVYSFPQKCHTVNPGLEEDLSSYTLSGVGMIFFKAPK